jgi:hypothetical protein
MLQAPKRSWVTVVLVETPPSMTVSPSPTRGIDCVMPGLSLGWAKSVMRSEPRVEVRPADGVSEQAPGCPVVRH